MGATPRRTWRDGRTLRWVGGVGLFLGGIFGGITTLVSTADSIAQNPQWIWVPGPVRDLVATAKPAPGPLPTPVTSYPLTCGDTRYDAVLLGVSEALDSTRNDFLSSVDYPDNLSGLALGDIDDDGLRRAFVVADDVENSRWFELRLGLSEPGYELYVSLEGQHHPLAGAGTDAESVAVEPLPAGEPTTLLVADEAGSRILRTVVGADESATEAIDLPSAWNVVPEGRAVVNRAVESLATVTTDDGASVFAGMETGLASDRDTQGRSTVRIKRWEQTTSPAGKVGYEAVPFDYTYLVDGGLFLTEFVAVDENTLLTLERGWTERVGNTIRIYRVTLPDDVPGDVAPVVKDQITAGQSVPDDLVVDLGTCGPVGDDLRHERQRQENPLLDNIEAMALDPDPIERGDLAGYRLLYLVSDNNAAADQRTRVYALAVRL